MKHIKDSLFIVGPGAPDMALPVICIDDLNDKEVSAVIAEAAAYLRAHPILKRYAPIDRVGKRKMTKAWHAMATFLAVQMAALEGDIGKMPPSSVAVTDRERLSLFGYICRCHPFFLRPIIMEHLQACPKPEKIRWHKSILPLSSVFFTWPGALLTPDRDDSQTICLFAVASDIHPCILCFTFAEKQGGLRFECRRLNLGTLYDPLETDFPESLLIKACAFVESPYVLLRTHSKTGIGVGRKTTPAEICQEDDGVSVVTLRTIVTSSKTQDGNGNAVDHKHHWWVRGHIRNQYLPSSDSHKPIWIAPHLAGPLDKPLLHKVYDVCR